MSRLFTVLLGGFAFLAQLGAQVTSATILGTVTDSSGAVVAKALVEAKAVATNLSRTTTTDAEGNYTLTSLPVGEYEVTISAAGFRKEVQRGITIQVQQRARLDVALQPGNVTETINAVGAAPIVNTEDGVFGDVIENQRVVVTFLFMRRLAGLVSEWRHAERAPGDWPFAQTPAAFILRVRSPTVLQIDSL